MQLDKLHLPGPGSVPFTYNSGIFSTVSGTLVNLPSFQTLPRQLRLSFLEWTFGGGGAAAGLDLRFTLDNVPGWASVFLRTGIPVNGMPIFALVGPLQRVTPILSPDYTATNNVIRLGGWYP